MYDSVTAANIPSTAQVVAGYLNGLYAWSTADWHRFPDAIWVTIVVTATNAGMVLDCEKGDATPADCPAWIKRRQKAGVAVPVIYCSLADMPAVQAFCAGLVFGIWCADWTGQAHIPDGAVACQYAALGSIDVSLCAPGWPR